MLVCLQEGHLSPELYSDTKDDETDSEGTTEDDEYYEDDETESGDYDDDDDVEIVSGSCTESDEDDEQPDNKVCFYFLTLPTSNYAFIVMMEIPKQLRLQYVQ